MKTLISLILITSSLVLNAQNSVTWSSPQVVNGAVGYSWPRVCVANGIPVVNWGDNMNSNIFISRFVSGNFTPPVQLNPFNMPVVVGSLTGPDMKTNGDTVYIVYIDGNATHVYLQRSFDGGVTFSDTIKVDNIGNNIPQYATVDILNDGNPVVGFAKLTATFNDPQYVVSKSHDAGSTFLPDVNATGALGADPCDCCPGSIACNGKNVAVIYRNSINDLRDFRAAVSTDTANSFSSLGVIDNNGWVIANCPSSGGHGVIHGDSLISVFMNGINGNSCFVSTYNMNTLQSGFERKLFDVPSVGNQNLPSIASSGDTIGVVWEEVINGNYNIMFTYSTSGASGLGIEVDTISDILLNGYHKNADIAYSNGKFYVVFSDAVASQFYYMEGTLGGPTGLVQNSASNLLSIFSTEDHSAIKIVNVGSVKGLANISINDAVGKVIENQNFEIQSSSETVNLNHPLATGIYLVSIKTKQFTISKQLIIGSH